MNKIILSVLIFAVPVLAQTRADTHAPIGVLGEHLHNEGEVMFSYRYMRMEMEGSLDGTSSVSDQEVLQDFMVVPAEMETEMHMFGVMVAPTDGFTLMAMLPYINKDMNHRTRSGDTFRTETSGVGDTKVGALVDGMNRRLIFNLGVSLPTGSIDERDDTPAQSNAVLPYPMQLGSGTVDAMPGITYHGRSGVYNFGAQGIGTVRLDDNDRNYTLGDRFDSSAWFGVAASENLSLSARATFSVWKNIEGADESLNPQMVQTADPDRQGGKNSYVGVGVNTVFPGTSLRFAAELLVPWYQDLDGPQLESEWMFVAGAQATL